MTIKDAPFQLLQTPEECSFLETTKPSLQLCDSIRIIIKMRFNAIPQSMHNKSNWITWIVAGNGLRFTIPPPSTESNYSFCSHRRRQRHNYSRSSPCLASPRLVVFRFWAAIWDDNSTLYLHKAEDKGTHQKTNCSTNRRASPFYCCVTLIECLFCIIKERQSVGWGWICEFEWAAGGGPAFRTLRQTNDKLLIFHRATAAIMIMLQNFSVAKVGASKKFVCDQPFGKM